MSEPAYRIEQDSMGKVQVPADALYGATISGIFRISTNGTSGTLLHQFVGSSDGRLPQARLVEASNGALYGTTSAGGISNRGTIFKINKDGSDYQILHHFAGHPFAWVPRSIPDRSTKRVLTMERFRGVRVDDVDAHFQQAKAAGAAGHQRTAMQHFFHANQYYRMSDVFLTAEQEAEIPVAGFGIAPNAPPSPQWSLHSDERPDVVPLTEQRPEPVPQSSEPEDAPAEARPEPAETSTPQPEPERGPRRGGSASVAGRILVRARQRSRVRGTCAAAAEEFSWPVR